MNALRVRIYNVRFGDAILISFPDAEDGQPKLRHILIDVGNALNKEGGADFVFRPVVEDIRAELGGAPIDLYIMTHEHMDHVQGLLYAEEKEGLPRLPVQAAWLTASAEPGYYERDWPTTDEDGNAILTPKQHLAQMETSYEAIAQFAAAWKGAGEVLPEWMQAMMLNNNPRKTADCVDYLRKLAPNNTYYIHREIQSEELQAMHKFEIARLEVWAPEENAATYYGRFQPMALAIAGGNGVEDDGNLPPQIMMPLPPRGVDASVFYKLVEARRNVFVDHLLAIDQSRNNSSIVFCLEWQGWKMLFPGDAELRSWQEMNKRNVLSPIHFLKISHHASHNGTPSDDLLEKCLPTAPTDGRERVAVASTFPNTYSGIPHIETLDRLRERGVSTFMTFEELGDRTGDSTDPEDDSKPVVGYLDFVFPAEGDLISFHKQVLAN
jgi:beta-lactamase superfamily II metal-dependent hydrolase